MLRCAVLDDYQDAAQRFGDWQRLAGRVEMRLHRQHFDSEEQVAAAVADCEIVVLMRERTAFPATLFARLPKLRLLVTTGMKNASIDLAAAAARGVAVAGTRGSGPGTAELTWGLALALARHIVPENAHFRSGGPWQSTVGIELSGRRLGVIGLGRLGGQVARIGAAFGMAVQAWSHNLTAEKCAAAGVEFAGSLDALLASSDLVTIHLVLSARTRGLIGAAELARMRPGAILVNTSRGPIVDETALVAALRARRIAGAALDVYDREPLPRDHPLRGLDNVLATPHIGYVTEECYRLYFGDAVDDIDAWLKGAPVRLLGAA